MLTLSPFLLATSKRRLSSSDGTRRFCGVRRAALCGALFALACDTTDTDSPSTPTTGEAGMPNGSAGSGNMPSDPMEGGTSTPDATVPPAVTGDASPQAPGEAGSSPQDVEGGPSDDAGDSEPAEQPVDSGTTTGWTQCENASCACMGVANCQRIQWTNTQPLGSQQFRVCGADQQQECTVQVLAEYEGGGTGYRCKVPNGTLTCDNDFQFQDISGDCEELFKCNVLLQTCPEELLPCPAR